MGKTTTTKLQKGAGCPFCNELFKEIEILRSTLSSIKGYTRDFGDEEVLTPPQVRRIDRLVDSALEG